MHKRQDLGRGGRFEREEAALKPIGLAVAAIVAGVSAPVHAEAVLDQNYAPGLAPQENSRTHQVDPTNHPSFEQDDAMVLGPSEPMEPFSAPARGPMQQGDLFQ